MESISGATFNASKSLSINPIGMCVPRTYQRLLIGSPAPTFARTEKKTKEIINDAGRLYFVASQDTLPLAVHVKILKFLSLSYPKKRIA